MNILAIETSTLACSVALYVSTMSNNQSMQLFKIAPRQHNQLILSMIDQLLNQNNIHINQLDAVAYSQGPGSFTGLRLAASVIQGLALAYDLPVIPISSLQIYAQTAYRLFEQSKIVVCQDAHMQALYWGSFQLDGDLMMQAVTSARCVAIKAIEDISLPDKNWFAVGDAWEIYADKIPVSLLKQIIYPKEKIYPHAYDMLNIARLSFEKKLWISAAEALPTYLQEIGNEMTN